MLEELESKKKIISVIGLGYVGLPLALEFAKYFKVIGFDISDSRVDLMKKGIDPSNELERGHFENVDIRFTSNPADIKEAHFHIIGVPTDIDEHKVPNLKPLKSASTYVGQALKKGDVVVYESTVYPGCTEDECLPILEKESGLSLGEFHLGYSPERINPGDKERTLTKILKIVSAYNEDTCNLIAQTYERIITAGVYKAQSIKVAEAAKVIENTQRDINIALMNELSIIFDRMDIDTKSVLEAAGTKWNFLKFYPGLVGGHCIGVDPYYLTYKSKQLGYIPDMILSGRKTNESIAPFIAKKLIQLLIKAGKNPGNCKVLIKGFTFKENVSDVRNTKVIDVVRELESFDVQIDVEDPYADPVEVLKYYNLELSSQGTDYDAVIVAVAHQNYADISEQDFIKIMHEKPILFDLKGMFRPMSGLTYWRL